MERIFIGIAIPKSLTSAVAQLYCDPKMNRHLRWVSEENLHLTITFIGEVSTEKRELIQNALRSVSFSAFSLKIANAIETFPTRAKRNIRIVHIPIISGSGETERKWSFELNELKSMIDSTLFSLEVDQTISTVGSNVSVEQPLTINDELMPESSVTITETATEPLLNTNGKGDKRAKKQFFQPHLTLARVKQRADVQSVLETIQDISGTMHGSNESFWNNMIFSVTNFVLFRSTLTPQGSIYEVLEEYHSI